MRTVRLIPLTLLLLVALRPAAADDSVNPDADFKAFRDYFTKRFPKRAAERFRQRALFDGRRPAQAMAGDR